MLYRYKPTGALLEKISAHGDGIVMCTDAQDEVHYVDEADLDSSITRDYRKNKN